MTKFCLQKPAISPKHNFQNTKKIVIPPFAVMNNDEAKAAERRDQLDMNERLEAGMFFVNAPQECGEVLEGN